MGLDHVKRVLVTGATGFAGRALAARLLASGYRVRCAVRRAPIPPARDADESGNLELAVVGNLESLPDWRPSLEGVDTVIHLAARVHVMRERASDPFSLYRQINRDATLHLAGQAAEQGVSRFIFLSTIKVNGESTMPGRPFTEDDTPAPVGPYAVSKWEAEQGLREIAARGTMAVAIVRPPMIYGPGVKGNFERFMRWADRGVPFPLAGLDNRRSLLGLGNLTDFLVTLVEHPAAGNELFLVCDGEDLSTPDLFRRIAGALDRKPRMVPLPPSLLRAAARVVGKGAVADRLCGSLQISMEKARRLLGWKPPASVNEGIAAAAKCYRAARRTDGA